VNRVNNGNCRRRNGFHVIRGVTETGGVQPAQRLVQADDVAEFRVVGEQHGDIVVLAEDVFGKAVQCLLRSDLDEDASAAVVQGLQALDELDRLGDLTAQQVDDGFLAAGAGGVVTAVNIGNQGNPRRPDIQPAQLLAQRGAGRSDDRGVESVADRQPDGRAPGGGDPFDDLLHRSGGSADDGLPAAVHVGDDHVALGRVDDLLDLLERSHDGREDAVVVHADSRHLPAACADRFESGRHRERACGHERLRTRRGCGP
jgi:hypothetical protein